MSIFFQDSFTTLHLGSSEEVLKSIESDSIPLVVTSPPYDDMRTYGRPSDEKFTFDFEAIAAELYRILMPGGVICWVVANQVKDWGESLTAERQRIHFQSLGMSVRKLIYHKLNFSNPNGTFYHRLHEDVTLCCKGSKPRAWNPIYDVPTVWKKALGRNTRRERNGEMKDQRQAEYGEFARRGDVWIGPTAGQENPCQPIEHPAVMPHWLALDLITSWSNEGDVVLDPFSGSATSAVAGRSIGRKSILVDREEKYCRLAASRLSQQILSFD